MPKEHKCGCMRIVAVAGIFMMIVGITADAIGLGVGGVIGWKQIVLIIAGCLAVFVGLKPCSCE